MMFLEQAPGLVELQRVDASGRLGVNRSAGKTRVETLAQQGAAKIRMPATAGDPLEAILINTAGGMTGGDRIRWAVDVGETASATVTTQACEKLYRSSYGVATMDTRLSVASGGRLAWLPQETIAYDGSAFARTLDVDLAENAEALILESTVFGRLAMGERTTRATFSDRWRIHQGGALIYAENFAVGPEVAATLERQAGTGSGRAIATILLVAADAADRIEAVRAIIAAGTAIGGASAWSIGGAGRRSGKLLARLVAEDSYSLRRTLGPLVQMLNGQAGLPKVWSL